MAQRRGTFGQKLQVTDQEVEMLARVEAQKPFVMGNEPGEGAESVTEDLISQAKGSEGWTLF